MELPKHERDLKYIYQSSSIGERCVQSQNKTLGWLGSSSAAGVFDSNGRDQGTIPDIGEAAQHLGQIIRGWALQVQREHTGQGKPQFEV